jgi:hypothetical protein
MSALVCPLLLSGCLHGTDVGDEKGKRFLKMLEE